MKTSIYIDGFNFYYGCLRESKFKWLDFASLSQRMFPENEITRIRYFTALIKDRSDDQDKRRRQLVFLRALKTIPNLVIHEGHFREDCVRMPLAHPPRTGPRTVEVIKTEEKGSDVNLATYLLVDGFNHDFELAVVFSNDSDLLEPIRVVRKMLGLKVGVVNPQTAVNYTLARAATFYKSIKPDLLSQCQFPERIQDSVGTITKPEAWK